MKMRIDMADVSGKQDIPRAATASGRIVLKPATVLAVKDGRIKKGDVLATAEVAAISAAKNCPSAIPLCHQIPLSKVSTSFSFGGSWIGASSTVSAVARTGVEMEALCAVSAALLTVWDMVKYLEKDDAGQYPGTSISDVRVVEKIKGLQHTADSESTASHRSSAPASVECAVITVSTSRSKENGIDKSGDIIRGLLLSAGHRIVESAVIPDVPQRIEDAIKNSSAQAVILTGGTGLTGTDGTVETARRLFTKEIEGFGELFRMLSYSESGSGALLSRATAGLVGSKAVFCLPGSPDACRLALERLVVPELSHIVKHAGEK